MSMDLCLKTYVANGMLRSSIPETNIWTIHVTVRPGGIFLVKGRGVILDMNGKMVTWTSHGLGHLSQGKLVVIGSNFEYIFNWKSGFP